MTNVVKLWNLGRVFYDKSNKIQKYIAKLHSNGDFRVTKENLIKHRESQYCDIHNTLLLIEHEPVYTAGLRDCISTEEEEKLRRLGAEYKKVDRGGLATFHGPGQLTAYPILNLRHYRPSVKWYVCQLEEVAIKTCAEYDIKAERSPHTGVWVGDRKICAIGVHVSRSVTTHGLALNCSTDLSWFRHIVPCGIEGKGVTSVSEELGKTVTVEDVLLVFKKCFEDVFDSHLVDMDDDEKRMFLKAVESC